MNEIEIYNPDKPMALGRADRLPPHNLEAEEVLIGSIMLDNSVLDEVEFIVPEDFYRSVHAIVWAAILAMRADGIPIDGITLSDHLQTKGTLSEVGGIEFIAHCSNIAPHAVNARYYADIIKQKSTQRSLIETCNATLNDCYSNNFYSEQLLAAHSERAQAITARDSKGEPMAVMQVFDCTLNQIQKRESGEQVGLTTGLSDLDDLTGGFQKGNFIVIAARTSCGKTTLALNLLDHIGGFRGIPSLFLTLEMSKEEIGERLLVARAQINSLRAKTGNLGTRDYQLLIQARESFRESTILIDEMRHATMAKIVAAARRAKSKHRIGFIVVDQISQIFGETARETLREQVIKITKGFKDLSRELEITVVALNQISRGAEDSPDKRPELRHLKESGSIEEDADMVFLIHRFDMANSHGKDTEAATLIVAKNRNGPTGDVKVTFCKTYGKFVAWHPEPEWVPPPAIDTAY